MDPYRALHVSGKLRRTVSRRAIVRFERRAVRHNQFRRNSGCSVPHKPRIKFGCGTVFQFTPPAQKGGSGTKTVLYTFPGFKGDGVGPDAEITFDSQGNIYSTTAGGTNGFGTVYQLMPPKNNGGSWTETVLYDFTGGNAGSGPGGTVTLGPAASCMAPSPKVGPRMPPVWCFS